MNAEKVNDQHSKDKAGSGEYKPHAYPEHPENMAEFFEVSLERFTALIELGKNQYELQNASKNEFASTQIIEAFTSVAENENEERMLLYVAGEKISLLKVQQNPAFLYSSVL